jgi:hypothetical protein
MAKHSLDDSLSSLNPPLDSYELFNEYLDRAYALVHVALSEQFAACEQLVIHNYLSLLDELLLRMRQVFKEVSQKIKGD